MASQFWMWWSRCLLKLSDSLPPAMRLKRWERWLKWLSHYSIKSQCHSTWYCPSQSIVPDTGNRHRRLSQALTKRHVVGFKQTIFSSNRSSHSGASYRACQRCRCSICDMGRPSLCPYSPAEQRHYFRRHSDTIRWTSKVIATAARTGLCRRIAGIRGKLLAFVAIARRCCPGRNQKQKPWRGR